MPQPAAARQPLSSAKLTVSQALTGRPTALLLSKYVVTGDCQTQNRGHHGLMSAETSLTPVSYWVRRKREQDAALAEEATARRIQVVSRTVPAEYRIRIYLAARAEGRQARISWVWDVYDAGKRRALRIDGDEAVERKAGDVWSATDDAMLRRIVRTSLDRLVTFLEAGPPPEQQTPEAAPNQDGTPIAEAPAPDSLAMMSRAQ